MGLVGITCKAHKTRKPKHSMQGMPGWLELRKGSGLIGVAMGALHPLLHV